MMPILRIENISKSYKTYKSDFHRFASWLGLRFNAIQEKYILKNITFDVYRGQSIGVIGENGAGKSTLLKIITGCLRPSDGNLNTNAKIFSILELGMGFDENLTGRQNSINALAMMGFNGEQINELIPKVKDFSEIGDFFDEPIRKYSTGMQARIAFSVVTAHRPEILIVDEVLAVGDAYFQHKSFARIKKFQEKGTTLLIVSHDKEAILNLCSRAILLDHGSIIKDGNPEEIFDFYNAIIAKKEKSSITTIPLNNNKLSTRSGSGDAKVNEIFLYNSKNQLTDTVNVGELVELHIKIKCFKSIDSLVFGYGIKDRLGQVMYGTNTWHTQQIIKQPKYDDEYLIKINFTANLGVGSYSLQTALVDRDTHLTNNYEWIDMALLFNVVNVDKVKFEGCLWCEPKILIEEIN